MTARWILATMTVLIIAGGAEAQSNDPVPSLLGRAAEAVPPVSRSAAVRAIAVHR